MYIFAAILYLGAVGPTPSFFHPFIKALSNVVSMGLPVIIGVQFFIIICIFLYTRNFNV